MTRDEVKTILATLASVYPPNLMPTVNELTVNVWFQLLQDIPYKQASASVAAWMQTSKYPPTIADIRERLIQKIVSEQKTPEQAWSELMRAIVRYGHTEKDLAQKELGELWDLVGRDWAYYCSLQEDQTPNEKARFIRMYAANQSKQKNNVQISAPIREVLESGQLKLGDGT